MSQLIPGPALWDYDGAPETVYLTRSPSRTTEHSWQATSLDVGSWRPLSVGDRIVALDRDSSDEFLVEVAEIDFSPREVFYRLRHLADLDPSLEPGLNSTRSWLPTNA